MPSRWSVSIGQADHTSSSLSSLSSLSSPSSSPSRSVTEPQAWQESYVGDEDRIEGRGSASVSELTFATSSNSASGCSTVLYIQTELCGSTLHDYVKPGCPAPSDDDRWHVTIGILKGLAYIHECGIIHRDLKPANIFIDSSGSQPLNRRAVKLGDFGLAKHTSDERDGAAGTVRQSDAGSGTTGVQYQIRPIWH